jgi:Right handed beta helix region
MIGCLSLILALAVEPSLYVAPNGNDQNVGSIASPLATLEEARNRARNLPKSAPIHVILRGGRYFQSKPLTLTKLDSGTTAAPVSWEAAPGESPVLSGGVILKGWTSTMINGRAAWSLRLPQVASGKWWFRSLYGLDGRRRVRVRAPRTGFYTVDSVEKRATDDDNWLNGRDRFFARPGDFGSAADALDSEVVVLTQWCDNHLPVTSFDPSTNFVTSSKFSVQNFAKGSRYWIENARWAMDQPGDWALNRKTGELLYLPLPGEDITKSTLVAPSTQQLLTLDGTQNVKFRGIQFQHAEWWFPDGFVGEGMHADQLWSIQQAASTAGGAVYGNSIANVSFDQCTFAHVGAYGIQILGPSQGVQIRRSRFFDLGAGGISIGERVGTKNLKDEEVSRDHVIADNVITGGGRIFTGTVAIFGGQLRRTQIVHNEISDFFYTGINLGWSWGFDGEAGRDNLIGWNRISNIGQNMLGDGACIYTLGVMPGTVIDNNVVSQSNGNYASRGIYLDDGSSEIVVRNNLSYDNRTANFFLWRSRNVKVYNNVFANGTDQQIELAGAIFNDGLPCLDFQRNVVFVNCGPLINNFDANTMKAIYQFRNNLIWAPGGGDVIPSSWKTVGWDAGSFQLDPLFRNPLIKDFRLRSNSPAFKKIGFLPIDWSTVGPRR